MCIFYNDIYPYALDTDNRVVIVHNADNQCLFGLKEDAYQICSTQQN